MQLRKLLKKAHLKEVVADQAFAAEGHLHAVLLPTLPTPMKVHLMNLICHLLKWRMVVAEMSPAAIWVRPYQLHSTTNIFSLIKNGGAFLLGLGGVLRTPHACLMVGLFLLRFRSALRTPRACLMVGFFISV